MIEVTLVYLKFKGGGVHHSFTRYTDRFDVDMWEAINHKFLEEHNVIGVEFENIMTTEEEAKVWTDPKCTSIS